LTFGNSVKRSWIAWRALTIPSLKNVLSEAAYAAVPSSNSTLRIQKSIDRAFGAPASGYQAVVYFSSRRLSDGVPNLMPKKSFESFKLIYSAATRLRIG